MSKLLKISEAAKLMGVSCNTLRRWEKEGKITPQRAHSGHRRYKIEEMLPYKYRPSSEQGRKTVAYARVSSHDQKEDLERQKQVLELYCAQKGMTCEIISDLGSGINYKKKGLNKLLEEIIDNKVGKLVLTHKDRLLRFGVELFFAICKVMNVQVTIINQGEDTTFEEDLSKDVLEIITVFSARLYGARSHKNKKLVNNIKKAIEDSI